MLSRARWTRTRPSPWRSSPARASATSRLSEIPVNGDRRSWIRELELGDINRYETELLDWMRGNHGDILSTIKDTGKLEEATKAKLVEALDAFGQIFQPKSAAAGEAA